MMANEKQLDLIDRKALLEKQYNSSPLKALQFAEMVVDVRDIEDAPTVDAVEVVHGEWFVEAYTADDSIVVIPYRKHQHNDPFCSRCGHHALLNCGDYVTSNYCPNCGAKMDGGNEDGKIGEKVRQ